MSLNYKDSLKRVRVAKEVEIVDLLITRPDITYDKVAEMQGVSTWLIKQIAKKFHITRPRGPKMKKIIADLMTSLPNPAQGL